MAELRQGFPAVELVDSVLGPAEPLRIRTLPAHRFTGSADPRAQWVLAVTRGQWRLARQGSGALPAELSVSPADLARDTGAVRVELHLWRDEPTTGTAAYRVSYTGYAWLAWSVRVADPER